MKTIYLLRKHSLWNQDIKLVRKSSNGSQKKHYPLPFFVASDSLDVGVLQVFNEHQIHVPTDTSIISINDINIAKNISPSLTTYHIDHFALANSAISLLADQINYEHNFHKTVYVGADLVKRDSFKVKK